MTISSGRLFLIDGSSQMYRAYHAIQSLTNTQGKPTNAVYGFVSMLRKLLEDHQPDFIAAAFDLPGPTFRNELDSTYKANRGPMPPDLAEQIPWIHEACESLGVPVITLKKYEADDVIGTLAMQANADGLEVIIVSGDKDFFQLVGNSVTVFNPKESGSWFRPSDVKKKFGVAPNQVIDVLALMGDSSDNVKGVPGIGAKGARDLINDFGSLDEILNKIPHVKKNAHRNALIQHKDEALHSRTLVTIKTDAPVTFDTEDLQYKGPDRKRCFDLFSLLGFKSLTTAYSPSKVSSKTDYQVINSLPDLEKLIRVAKNSDRYSLHVIADKTQAKEIYPVGLAISLRKGHGRYIPLNLNKVGTKSAVSNEKLIDLLSPLLADNSIQKTGHDLKFLNSALSRHGARISDSDIDTMIVSYLLDSTRTNHDLEALALEILGHKIISTEDLLGRGKKAGTFQDLQIPAITKYACECSDLVLQLGETLYTSLVSESLEDLYRNIELPLIPILGTMESFGIGINTTDLAEMSTHLEQELSLLQGDIYKLAGSEFNINSPKQLSKVLFEDLNLTPTKRTGKTRVASTAIGVLEELALTNAIPRKVLVWRSLQKLKGTYIDALPKMVNSNTSRVHTSFNQTVTATGRLSSSEPNLQNIPIRTKIGRQIRSAFVAPPESMLISADYSQIELRVLAHLSQDANLIAAFKRNEDIHTQTALKIFGTNSILEAHELRRRAKMVNYALLYGKTAFTLAKDIGVTQKSAQKFIDAYFDEFPNVRSYIDHTLIEARKHGFVQTMYGRKRKVPELTSKHGQIRAAAERVAVNMPIQGTAADILKMAMIDIHKKLPKSSIMILTVHDELLFEVPKTASDTVTALVKERMEQVVSLDVPLIVDIGAGNNWKDAKS
tara:strand:+ start:48974 stop:51652 length:2679 start_codon:yes stop_codon:yes gene_type:complete